MPRLVKGGKYIYGLSRISPKGTIVIPPEAMDEYGYSAGDKVIIMSGSWRSGGFGLTQKRLLEKSALSVIVKQIPDLMGYRIPEAETVEYRGRRFCWTVIQDGGSIDVPLGILSDYGLKPGDMLAVGKGSYLSIAFIARGLIIDEAMKHPELEIFEGR